MQPFMQRIKEAKPLVADGAMGTMLFRRNLKPGHCPESLNLTDPEILAEIAAEYLQAGAEIVQTNTFGASPLKLAIYKLDDQAGDIIRAAVRAVRSTVDDRAYVSGSCGPSGRMLQPYGEADPDDVLATFRTQMEVLIDAGVDVICVETMIDLAEARLAVQAAKEVSADIPVMATMTFEATPRGYFTIMGTDIEHAVSGLRDAGADVVGSNCGQGIGQMIGIARRFREITEFPLLIQPNAGLPDTKNGVPVYSESPEFMAKRAKELVSIGVNIIGGCCGTTPDHIRALREMVDSVTSPQR